MPTRNMRVSWEGEDAHLTQSRKKPGEFSPLTRDGDNNLGQVTLSEIDEDDEDWLTDPAFGYAGNVRLSESQTAERSEEDDWLGALVVLGVIVAARKAAPHVSAWWNDKSPALKATWARLVRTRRAGSQVASAGSLVAAEDAPAGSSQQVFTALEQYRASMSSAEARNRLAAALVARLFSEEQLRVLRDARIEDDGGASQLVRAIDSLTPQQLEGSIVAMLEANPSWPDEQTLAELARVLGPGAGDGDYLPAPPR